MRIAELKKVPAGVQAALHSKRIETTEELWRRIGTDFFIGLKGVAGEAGRSEEDVVAVLTAELLYEPSGWARTLLVVVAVLALGGLIAYRLNTPPNAPEFVLAQKTLPALHLVAEGDVMKGPSESAGLEKAEDAIGRRLLLPIAKGEALTEAHLTPEGVTPKQLRGRVLLELPLEGEASELEAAVGSRVTLLFSPRVLAGQGGLEAKALVLAIDSTSGENVAMVAVEANQVSAITRFLATSEISIARGCCPESRDPPVG